MKTFSVFFTPESKEDALDAYFWYEQYSPELGKSFHECLDSKIELLKQNPKTASYIYKDLRSSKIKKFPFNIIYKVTGSQIHVIAIFHHSRNPKEWRKRL